MQAAEEPMESDPEEAEGQDWQSRTRRKASLLKMRSGNAFYRVKAWCQAAGHQLMHWLSVLITRLKALWPKLSVFLSRLWSKIKTPFIRKLA